MHLDAEKMIRTVARGSMLLRGSSTRQGMVEHLPASTSDVLVAGDLHGNINNLRKILDLAQLEGNPHRHLVLQEFVHGTERYPNGGCTSHRLLDILCALKERYPQRVHLIMGNHEMAQWTGRRVAKDGTSLNDLFELGIEWAYGERAAEMSEAYDNLFASMLLAVRTENRLFISHSLPDGRRLPEFDMSIFERMGLYEEDVEKGGAAYELVWGRDVSESTVEAFRQKVNADFFVTGHIPQTTGHCMPNSRQLILDCVGTPAGCVLLSATNPLNFNDIEQGIRTLPTS